MRIIQTDYICCGKECRSSEMRTSPTQFHTLPPCDFCLEELIPLGRWQDVKNGVRQCDHPIGGHDERGLAKTCDKYICLKHALRLAQFDFCPEHRAAHENK